MSSETLTLHIAIAKRRDDNPQHWILILCPPKETRGTYYHVKGGPTQGVPYEVFVEANKRLDSTGLERTIEIATMPASEQKKVLAAARAIPEQYCQSYVVGVLEKLEKKGLVPAGTSAKYAEMVEEVSYGE